MERRYFSDEERWHLYAVANGKCSLCGLELHGIFQADHIEPYSKGGKTTLDNGQVLCERCNGMKSDKYTTLPDCNIDLRYWQAAAFDVYIRRLAENAPNVLINATPGAGKTWFGLYVAHHLMSNGIIDRVIVVVPTDELRTQWQIEASTFFGMQLASVFDSVNKFAPDYHGLVTTYATILARHGNYSKQVSNLINGKRTLAIIDEIHHVAEGLNWAISLEDALLSCFSRLVITGTPFRSDRNPIPFVEYIKVGDALICKADYTYGYGEALRDGVVRPVYFQTYDGDISWLDGNGTLVERTFDDKVSSKEAAIRLRMALRTDGDWLTTVLKDANDKLEEMRKTDASAGGLVVAKDTEHAWAIAQVMNEFGVSPIVVTSKLESGELDTLASDKLNQYKNSNTPWIIAVKMVSEGIDIKRLRVGVWATNIQTELFFRQVLGRILRMDKDGIDDQYSIQFIPKVEPITTFAETVKKERHHVIDDLDAIDDLLEELRKKQSENGDYITDGVQMVDAIASKGVLIVEEDRYTTDEMQEAKRMVQMLGEQATDKNMTYTARLMRLLQGSAQQRTATHAVNGTKKIEKPLEGKKRAYTKKGGVLSRLRSSIQSATEGQVTHEHINRELNRAQEVVSQTACTLDQLEQRCEILKAWRKACDNGTWRQFTPTRYVRQLTI